MGVVVYGKMLDYHVDLQEPNLWVPARPCIRSRWERRQKADVRVCQLTSRAPGRANRVGMRACTQTRLVRMPHDRALLAANALPTSIERSRPRSQRPRLVISSNARQPADRHTHAKLYKLYTLLYTK
jgi:hypothetical protein